MGLPSRSRAEMKFVKLPLTGTMRLVMAGGVNKGIELMGSVTVVAVKVFVARSPVPSSAMT